MVNGAEAGVEHERPNAQPAGYGIPDALTYDIDIMESNVCMRGTANHPTDCCHDIRPSVCVAESVSIEESIGLASAVCSGSAAGTPSHCKTAGVSFPTADPTGCRPEATPQHSSATHSYTCPGTDAQLSRTTVRDVGTQTSLKRATSSTMSWP
ncbi:hypothetical protein LY76DRAFT_587199 [Colletotrichum caudatum]|nr:hypothetical protein LY76DRAFT_587199 [Colletotrichum caudatum]